MDNKKILDIKNQIDNLTSRLSMLEELHKETMEKIKDTQEKCSHEFVFIYRKYENKAYDYIQYGKCLACGKIMVLSPENINLDTNELISDEQIIDVVMDDIEHYNLDCDCNKNIDLLHEAENIFNNMINNNQDNRYSKCCIKREIFETIKGIKLTKKKK